MTRPGGGAHGGGGAAHDRLAEEARATASALLEWLGTRVDQAAAPGGYGARPAQSPGPCTWCPVCALVAAMRGEQPELTARLAEQASGFMMLLRAMAQAHDGHGHAAHPAHDHGPPERPAPEQPGPTPPGWPTEWGAPSWSPGPAAADAPRSEAPRPDAPTPDRPVRGRVRDTGPGGTPRRTSVRTAAFRPTRAAQRDPEPGPSDASRPAAASGTPDAAAAPAAPRESTRPSRPGPRRAPARTTSPRTAARRPSPRAASMPAPGGEAVEAVERARPEQAHTEQAHTEQAHEPPRAEAGAGRPVVPPPGAAPASPAAARPRPPVQPISVRRRPDA